MATKFTSLRISLFDDGNDFTRIVLSNEETKEYATIIPELGGAVEQLCLRAKTIDEVLNILHSPTPHEFLQAPIPAARKGDWMDTYQSMVNGGILAPWVNRIAYGKYIFDGKQYQLHINEPSRHNALHGLVFHRPMTVIETQSSNECAQVILEYKFNSSPETSFEGYPFHVTMRVTYCLKESSFNISVHAEVTGDTLSAPFAVGWHPYITFNDTTVNRSRLSIPPNIQLIFNDNMIPVGSEVSNGFGEVLGGKTLDDCFYFNSLGDAVTLTHPLGVATISISGDTIKTFQVYTPPSRYSIAIEPCSAAPNAFNMPAELDVITQSKPFQANFGITLS